VVAGGKVSILFLTTVLPGERRTGGEVGSMNYIEALRATGRRVTVVGYRRPGSRPEAHEDDVAVAERPIETAEAPRWRAAAWMGRAIARREPYSVAKYRSRAYARVAKQHAPEIVVVDHLQAPAPPIDARTVYNAANAEYEMYAQLDGRVMKREAKHVRTAESALVRRVDESWTVSRADADALERIGAKRTRVFDMPASAPPPPDDLPEPEIDVAMLGTWTWGANAVGLEWFENEIRPRLNGLRVEVAGMGSERGPVPDAEAFLRRARVVVVPRTSGTGIQIKTLNAIASGRAVVAATSAVRGLGELPPTVAVTDDPDEFAAALREARANPSEAREWLEERRARFNAAVAEAVA
jgi:hypothetical protein